MSLESLIKTGTKLWLDGVDPEDVKRNRAWGATGATSNPSIISEIIEKGGLDERIGELIAQGLDDEAIAWTLDDELVKAAQEVFLPVWESTRGDDGYVSFELDPLLEVEEETGRLERSERTRRYIELGKKWSAGHRNRMIKVPATSAGIDALEELAAAGVSLNVTLMFSERQYRQAVEAVWRGAQRRRDGLNDFKSVYSIFISRLDVYTGKRLNSTLSAAQGQVGIAVAKRVWRANQEFWKGKPVRLKQEIVFASTGVKNPAEPPDKYVAALAGSDIQTNPPKTNDAVQRSDKAYTRTVDQPVPPDVEAEIVSRVDMTELERALLAEGTVKFIEPQNALLQLIAKKRADAAISAK